MILVRLLPVRTLPAISMLVLLAACTNPYGKFYTDLSSGADVKSAPFVETHSGNPEILEGSNSDEEIDQLIANGWLAIGYSSFSAGSVDPSMALAHAQQIGAHLVVVSNSYQGTVSGSMPLTLPSTTTTNHTGTVAGYGGSAMYGGTSTTYGTTTSYIPYSVDRYEYLATYWIKRKSGGWGIYCNDLTPEQRASAGTNKGIFVANVANNGSAYEADILPGDIIIAIDDRELRGCGDFESVAASVVGREAVVVLIRNGAHMMAPVYVHPYS
jgi:PDZ domain